MRLGIFGVPLSRVLHPSAWNELDRRSEVTGRASEVRRVRLWPTSYVLVITRESFCRLPDEIQEDFLRRSGR